MLLRCCFCVVTVAIWLCCCTTECGAVGVPLLVFPPTAPTRVQIISGIGIPVDLHFESVEIGYVLKAEYFLPENASNVIDILGDPFNPSPRPLTNGRRRRYAAASQHGSVATTEAQQLQGYDADLQQRFERYDAVAVEVDTELNTERNIGTDADYQYEYEMQKDTTNNNHVDGNILHDDADDANDDADVDSEATLPPLTLADVRIKERNNLYTARFALYRGFEAIVQRNGLPGRPCMLRSICEAAHAPFSYDNGILGELAHIVMSPSTSPDPIVKHADSEYLRAEQLGRAGEPCGQVFQECPVSVLDKFSGMYNMMDGILNVLG